MGEQPRRDVIVMGASAGGVEALRAVVGALPADLAAVVLVVLHMPRDLPSALPAILSRSGVLPATHAVDRQVMERGQVYVAPADRHLLVLDGHLRLSRGPAENGHRPAVDALFRSAAHSFGARVIGVVLSGARDDGAAGLASIVAGGGVAVVQSPADALYPSMPQAALERVAVEHVLPAAEIGGLLGDLARTAADAAKIDDPAREAEVDVVAMRPLDPDQLPDRPGGYGCPQCGGALFEIHDETMPRYRCRIGHGWSAEALLAEQSITMEGALWTALRALEEKAELSTRMARACLDRDRPRSAGHYEALAAEAQRAVRMVREMIASLENFDDGAAGGRTGPA
jgi:two-component system chemotaxis response regulator CheB